MHFHVIASDACVLLMGTLPAWPGACCIPFPGLGSLRDMDDDRNRTAQGKPLRTGNEEPRDSASSLACLCGMSSASVRLACKEFLSEDVVKFMKARAERGMNARAKNNRYSNLKAYLRYRGYDTRELSKPPKYDKTMPEIYTKRDPTKCVRASARHLP